MRENWEKPVLSDYQGETFTFADLASNMARLHRVFEAAGVQPGDRVALAARNSARWAMAFLSIATYRGVAVSILADFNPIDIAGLVNHSDSKVLFTDPKIWEAMQSVQMPELKATVNVEDFSPIFSADDVAPAMKRATVQSESFLSAQKEAATNFEVGGLDDLAIINYTSGTTSSPKGVMLSVRNLSSNIEFGLNRIPVQKGDQIMSMLPLAHMYGMAFEFLYPLCGGCHIYFLGKTPTPTILMQALADIKPYLLITVPLVLEKIFKNKVMPTLQKPALRILTSIPGVKNLIYGKVRKQLMGVFGGNIRSFVIGGAAISRPVLSGVRGSNIITSSILLRNSGLTLLFRTSITAPLQSSRACSLFTSLILSM